MDNLFSRFYLPEEKIFKECSQPVKAYLVYRDFRINLLTGEKEAKGVQDFLTFLNLFPVSNGSHDPIFIHLFFELGYKILELEHLLPAHKPLAIYLHYKNIETLKIEQKEIRFKLEPKDYPQFKHYKKKFKQVYENLIDGNCYQMNLTQPFYIGYEQDYSAKDILDFLWRDESKIAPFAHASYLGPLNKLFFSNTPECLFKIEKDSIYSLPIKGTVKLDGITRKQAWLKLTQDKKEQGELYMITDLVRNDLTKVALNPSKVINKKKQLNVPKIVHQYSVVKSQLNKNSSLGDIVYALFPGGSITGAPKKSVMKLINEIEGFHRGFYCGSTIIWHQGLKQASINIRSSEFDLSLKEFKYGSGGGVTLLSDAKNEFNECFAKLQSFLTLFN